VCAWSSAGVVILFLSVWLPATVYSTPGYMKVLRSTDREVDETLTRTLFENLGDKSFMFQKEVKRC